MTRTMTGVSSFTTRIKCPNCGSVDCNDTIETGYEVAGFRLIGQTIFCNTCGYEARKAYQRGHLKPLLESCSLDTVSP